MQDDKQVKELWQTKIVGKRNTEKEFGREYITKILKERHKRKANEGRNMKSTEVAQTD